MNAQLPDRMAFQRMDDSFAPYVASVNLPERTLALTKKGDKNWRANFTFQRPAEDHLILDGRMDNHQVHMELQLTDRNSFLLVSRGFHWVNEHPFSRYYRDHGKQCRNIFKYLSLSDNKYIYGALWWRVLPSQLR